MWPAQTARQKRNVQKTGEGDEKGIKKGGMQCSKQWAWPPKDVVQAAMQYKVEQRQMTSLSRGWWARQGRHNVSVDDSRIRSKTALLSFENELVWTGPHSSLIHAFSLTASSLGIKKHFSRYNHPHIFCMCSKALQSDDRLPCDIEISGKTQNYRLKSVSNFKVTRLYFILLCKQHNWTWGTKCIEIVNLEFWKPRR